MIANKLETAVQAQFLAPHDLNHVGIGATVSRHVDVLLTYLICLVQSHPSSAWPE